jgi:hypothetical protein
MDGLVHKWRFLNGPVTGTWSAFGQVGTGQGGNETPLTMMPDWTDTFYIYPIPKK